MHSLKSTYKQTLAFLSLSIYLCCTLSIPIFEGVHFILHLGDDTQFHSFQSHQSIHDHQILTALNDLVEEDFPSEFPLETFKKIKIKKLVQISTSFISTKPLVETTSSQIFEKIKQDSTSPFLQITAPPPKV